MRWVVKDVMTFSSIKNDLCINYKFDSEDVIGAFNVLIRFSFKKTSSKKFEAQRGGILFSFSCVIYITFS